MFLGELVWANIPISGKSSSFSDLIEPIPHIYWKLLELPSTYCDNNQLEITVDFASGVFWDFNQIKVLHLQIKNWNVTLYDSLL